MMLLREPDHAPLYLFPEKDLKADFLQSSDYTSQSELKGEGKYTLVVKGPCCFCWLGGPKLQNPLHLASKLNPDGLEPEMIFARNLNFFSQEKQPGPEFSA